MAGPALRRGLAAGLLAGLLAGIVGLVIGEPALSAAIALEEGGAGGMPRVLQLVGLPLGTALVGLGVGAVFAVVALGAFGRVQGDGLGVSLKLGAAAVYALVVLPALVVPANPPGVGSPGTVGGRTGLYLGVVALGLVLAATAWAAAHRLAARGIALPARWAAVGAGLALVTLVVVAVVPGRPPTGTVPSDLVESFRLRSLAVQAVLHGGTAALFGLLTRRAG